MEIINSKLIGTGACIPDFVLTNAMLENGGIPTMSGSCSAPVCASAASQRIHIHGSWRSVPHRTHSRTQASPQRSLTSFSSAPARRIPTRRITASILQDKLGARQVGAFDINNACTGFVSATDIADSYIKSGKAKTVLVVSAETLSRIVDYTDRSTCILFGDGAAAAVYQATEDETVGILSTFTAADGSGAEYLHMEALPVEDPLSGDRTVDPKARFLKMQGAPVVRFTARAVPLAIDTALKRAGVTAEEIDWVVPHQANLRILDVIARQIPSAEGEDLRQYGPFRQYLVGKRADLPERNA